MWCVLGFDCGGVSRLALCSHLHQSWGKSTMHIHWIAIKGTYRSKNLKERPSYGPCLGGHHARVPHKEVWRTAHPYLPLLALPLPVCGHQDFSKSLELADPVTWIPPPLLLNIDPCSVLPTGGHVLRRHFHQPGPGAEHLPGGYCPALDHGVVHRHRFVHSKRICFGLKNRILISLSGGVKSSRTHVAWLVYLWGVIMGNRPCAVTCDKQ